MSAILEALATLAETRDEYRAAVDSGYHGDIQEAEEGLILALHLVSVAEPRPIDLGLNGMRRIDYTNTPNWYLAGIPLGRSMHLGAGIWATRCATCGQAFTHDGAAPYYMTAGRHEYEAHQGAQVVGINVAMLP